MSILAAGGTVSAGADAISVTRQALYQHREVSDDFRTAWDDAVDEGADVLEAEAFRRAVKGVEEPIYHNGHAIDTVWKYSDTLLIFLLKGRRPEKYRDNYKVEHSGPGGGPIPVRTITVEVPTT